MTPRRTAPIRNVRVFGADPALVDAILGDLAEEFAERMARDGVARARWWYASEAMRSAPHLVGRARLAIMLTAVASCVAIVAIALGRGAPARIVAGGSGNDGVLVNSTKPITLPVRVLDARGHALSSDDVRYRWIGGVPLRVAPRGVVTCRQRGDAVVRATVGTLGTDIAVHCQPVRLLRWAGWGNFILGDAPRDLIVDAIGTDGQPVRQIGAWLRVEDSTVATLAGGRLRPLKAGATNVEIQIGDDRQWSRVIVFEPVPSLEALRSDQRFVVAPARVAPRATLQWRLPIGLFAMSFQSGGSVRPTVVTDGAIMCMPEIGPRTQSTRCLVRAPGATLTLAHPGTTTDDARVSIALERQR